MQDVYDLILKGGVVVNQDGTGVRDIAVSDGCIGGIGKFEKAAEIIDCSGLHILPGVIDTQVHFREPGAEHKEDLETGSRAAVIGGVTAVFEMPNTNPPTVTADALADKVRRASGRMHCDFAFFVGGTRDNAGDLARLERLPGSAGVKVFMGSSTGELLVDDDDDVLRILSGITRRAAFHSEDEARLIARLGERRPGDPSSHAMWRDAEAARRSTERLLALARRAGKRVHVLHVSTADELPLLAANREVTTVEATPHHLTFSSEHYERLGNRLQMNPPVRHPVHRDALWRAVQSGLVDILGSDHAPHTITEKARLYPESPSGMPGVQTLVPVMLDHVAKGRLTLERFVDLTSHGPARVFGIARKGRIAQGYDADFTIVDLGRRQRIENSWIESRCGWTPYDGMEVTGSPVMTIVRGRPAMREGKITSSADGRPISFNEALSGR